ncbi:MAG: hypothetical protein EOM50_15925 [Erysipelotrichia bacterium]|nr:hypothetical protein [Erysipelotrichia bacterium]
MLITTTHKYKALSSLIEEMPEGDTIECSKLQEAVRILDEIEGMPEHSDDVQAIRDLNEIISNKIYDGNIDVFFDVEKPDTDTLIAIFEDITIEMNKRYESMSREQIEHYIISIENIPFSE